MFNFRRTQALDSRKQSPDGPPLSGIDLPPESEGRTYTCDFIAIVWSGAQCHNFQRAKPLADRSWTKIPLQAGRRGLSLPWMMRSRCDISPVA